ETALFVLSIAVLRPEICARIFSEMTRAAGPSAPRLTFRPVDSFSSELDRLLLVFVRLCWAVSEATLLLIASPIVYSRCGFQVGVRESSRLLPVIEPVAADLPATSG